MKLFHKYIIIIGLILIGPITNAQETKRTFREKIVLELYEQNMKASNYTQAYFQVKYMEKFDQRDVGFWLYNKIKCLVYIANFHEPESPFVQELKTSIAFLKDLQKNKPTETRQPQHLNPANKAPEEKLDLDIKALAINTEDDIDEGEAREETNDDEPLEDEDDNDENESETIKDEQPKEKLKFNSEVAQLIPKSNSVDMDWVYRIQMNYLNEGPLIDAWKLDAEYEKGKQQLEKKSFSKAYENLYYATTRNNGLALLALANMNEKGLGVPKDLGKAVNYYEQAANLFMGPAYLGLAELLRNNEEGKIALDELNEEELSLYFQYLEQAANLNVAKAKYLLAEYYLDAPSKENKSKNAIVAYNWMAKAAADGSIEAQYMMAVMHCKGIGTFRSHDEAQYWIELLSKAQIISAQKIVELQNCIKDL